MEERKFLDVKDIQRILHLSERSVFRLIREGKLSGLKVGRMWQFEQSDIDAYYTLQREEAKRKIARNKLKDTNSTEEK